MWEVGILAGGEVCYFQTGQTYSSFINEPILLLDWMVLTNMQYCFKVIPLLFTLLFVHDVREC